MQRLVIHAVILVLFGASVLACFEFTAEDAYITYRYAGNLVTTGALTFNAGEPVNALTSPLHALLSAVLLLVSGNVVLANKILGIILVAVSGILVWRRFEPGLQPLPLTLILGSPCLMLWAVGGLETPLLLFMATLAVVLAGSGAKFSTIAVLASIAFLTRYDSALFFAPIVIHAWLRAGSSRQRLVGIALGILLPAAWIVFSTAYYGDPLPTSFHEKTPQAGIQIWGRNLVYMSLYLVYLGLVPAAALAFVVCRSPSGPLRIIRGDLRARWWLYSAILLQLIYGFTAATIHMMFSFRYFVPYVPAAVLLVVGLLRAHQGEEHRAWAPRAVVGFCLCVFLVQSGQIALIHSRSLNLMGEYRRIGVTGYGQLMDTLSAESDAISEHWAGVERDRPPRIYTYAAGMLPWRLRDAYVYSSLISYRHGELSIPHRELKLSADYIHVLAPRHGKLARQLPLAIDEYELVSSHQMEFDGRVEQFLVYYNPAPEPHRLASRVWGW